jgi:hypothetical protein
VRLVRAIRGSRAVVGSTLAATLAAAVAVAALQAPEAPAPAAAVAVLGPLADVPAEPLGRSAARSRAVAPPGVAPLGELRVPDLLVTVRTSLTPAQTDALRAVRGVEAVTVVEAGTVRVGGKAARVLGVDASEFRPFTPRETASSDPLWMAVARGEIAPSYGLAQERALELGSTVTLEGLADVPVRIGAVAGFGLPGVDVVTDRTVARRLGVLPSSAVVVSAPDRDLPALRTAVRAVVGEDAVVDVLRPEVAARQGKRPTTYRELYIDSARYCPGLSWTVLAAIGQVESAHGKHLGPSSAGALGPMQFLPSTWEAYGIDGDGGGDIMSPYDAVPSAAGYLCRFGANRGEQGLYDAIFAYNHADWYVKKVLGVAAQYR